MSVRVFCDVCKEELTRNMVTDRLVVESAGLKAEVIVSKNDIQNNADLCLTCLLKMLNQKPKRRYVRKQQRHLIAQDGLNISSIRPSGEPVPLTKGKGKLKRGGAKETNSVEQFLSLRNNLEIADNTGDNLSIHVPTGLKGDRDYIVNIAGSEARSPVGLRVTILAALEKFDGKIPDELTDQERQIVQGILEAGK